MVYIGLGHIHNVNTKNENNAKIIKVKKMGKIMYGNGKINVTLNKNEHVVK